MEDILAEKLITSTYYKLNLVKEQIAQILLESFPSDNPKQLAKILDEICNLLQEYLLQIEKDIPTQSTDVILLTKFIANTVGELASHLRFIEGANTEKTPWSIVLPFQSFVNTIYSRDVCLIVRPQWHYNYKIIWNLVEAYKEHIEKGLGKKINIDQEVFKKKIYIVSFPGFEKNNILLHANLGHEIGHPIASEFLLMEEEEEKKKPLYFPKIATELDKILSKYLESNATELEIYVKKGELQAQIALLRQRGLEEIISDLISVNLFGLASLFATEEIADISQSIDDVKAPQYYPPLRMRLRLMYEELLSNGLEFVFKGDATETTDLEKNYDAHILESIKLRIDVIKATISTDTDKDNIQKDPLLKIAYDSITDALPKVKGFIKSKIGENAFDLQKTRETVLQLCNRIAHRIPPNAVEKNFAQTIIADIPLILNAGWFYKVACLSKISSYKDQKLYIDELTTINNLLLKAIELSFIHKDYNTFFTGGSK